MTTQQEKYSPNASRIVTIAAANEGGSSAAKPNPPASTLRRRLRGPRPLLCALFMLSAWCAPASAEVATDESCMLGYEGVESFATCVDGRLAVSTEPAMTQEAPTVAATDSASRQKNSPEPAPEREQ